jgi:hypothetical protein
MQFVKGVWEGIKFGFTSDVDLIRHPGQLVTGLLEILKLPLELTLFQIKIAIAIVKAVLNPTATIASVKNLLNSIRQAAGLAPVLLDFTPMLINLSIEGLGFAIGFVLYMIAQAALIALVTAGIGALADVAVQALTKGVRIAGLVIDAEKILQFFIFVVRGISTIGGDAKAIESALTFIVHNIPTILKAIDTAYQFSAPVLNAIGRLFVKLTPDVLLKVFEWLVEIQKMGDAAAVEFLRFAEQSAADGSKLKAAVTRWLAFANGSRGIADVFTAFAKAADLSEGAREAAVIAASFTDAAEAVIPKFVPKYGDQAEKVLLALKATADDATFTNNTIARVIQLLIDDRVPVSSPEAVRGMAWTIQKECLGL